MGDAGAQAAVTHDANVFRKLESLEDSLKTLLSSHVQEIKALCEDRDRDREVKLSDMDKDSKEAQSHVHTHLKQLGDLFDGYVQRILQARLNSEFPGGQEIINEEKMFDTMRAQFNTELQISTFTASLIISFVSLSKSLLNDTSYSVWLFNTSTLLSLFACVLFIFNIIISGRSAAVCLNRTWRTKKKKELLQDALDVCEQLHSFGILIFSIAVLGVSFAMFKSVIYPSVLCGVAVLLYVVIVFSRYKEMLVVYRIALSVKKLVGGEKRVERVTVNRSIYTAE